jgi:hypothetical protein
MEFQRDFMEGGFQSVSMMERDFILGNDRQTIVLHIGTGEPVIIRGEN